MARRIAGRGEMNVMVFRLPDNQPLQRIGLGVCAAEAREFTGRRDNASPLFGPSS